MASRKKSANLYFLIYIFRTFTVIIIKLGLLSESCSVMSNSLWPRGLYSPWDSPGQNTGVGGLSLLQESNPGLPGCRRILYQLSHSGSLKLGLSPPFYLFSVISVFHFSVFFCALLWVTGTGSFYNSIFICLYCVWVSLCKLSVVVSRVDIYVYTYKHTCTYTHTHRSWVTDVIYQV